MADGGGGQVEMVLNIYALVGEGAVVVAGFRVAGAFAEGYAFGLVGCGLGVGAERKDVKVGEVAKLGYGIEAGDGKSFEDYRSEALGFEGCGEFGGDCADFVVVLGRFLLEGGEFQHRDEGDEVAAFQCGGGEGGDVVAATEGKEGFPVDVLAGAAI